MINFARTNNTIGWLVFAVALGVYALTLESSVSFWDCGEFIAASYKLQIVHPPGAPLYQMLGRVFSLLALGNVQAVAFWVNMLSAVAAAFCVLFTYFITTRIAAKIISPVGLPLVKNQALMVWGSGVVAGLSLTFTDTFWFSAVEAEVYALSSLFTVLVFWAALRWDDSRNARWLLFIALAVGLSIGVHLLNLLAVPAVVLIIYCGYRGYSFLHTSLGLLLGVCTLLVIQFGIIPGLPLAAALADRWLVNGFGAAMGSGIAVFFVLLAFVLAALLVITRLRNWAALHTAVLGLVFVLIGYSSYTLIPIRAAAHPPVNINVPSDAFSFLSYLNREQYGQRALLHGPYFNAPITGFKVGKPFWRPVNGKYAVVGYGNKYEYDAAYTTLFPRMGDLYSSSSQTGYVGWTGVDPNKPPTFDKNLEFFVKYQLLHMYVRYHLWNFAGRQNNRQGHGNALNGNGVSGIGFIDEMVAAPADNLPAAMAANKGRNHYYFLPLLLGLAGLFFHSAKNRYGFVPLLVLFLFTGVFLCIYLNIPPFEPRERDYVYVGSFQVFCVWVGLGALWLMRKLHTLVKKGIWIGLIISMLAAPFILAAQNWDDHDRHGRSFARSYAHNYLQSLAPNAVLFVYGDNDSYPLWYLQNVEGVRPDVRIINANLLNTDWAAFELVRPQYQSQPLKLTINPAAYQNDMRELVRVSGGADTAVSFGQALAYIGQDTAAKNTFTFGSGRVRVKLPAKKLFFSIDAAKAGSVLGGDTTYRVPRFEVDLSSSSLFRAEVLMLDIIANNFYERPIYFASLSEAENLPQLNPYLRLEGLAYRLVPAKYTDTPTFFNRLNTGQMAAILQTFDLSGYNNPALYADPDAIAIAHHYRNLFSHTAEKMMAEGNTQQAAKMAALCEDALPATVIEYKYPQPALVFLRALYSAGNTAAADKQYAGFSAQLIQKTIYYHSLKGTIADYEGRTESEKSINALQELSSVLLTLNQKEKAGEIQKFLALYPATNAGPAP